MGTITTPAPVAASAEVLRPSGLEQHHRYGRHLGELGFDVVPAKGIPRINHRKPNNPSPPDQPAKVDSIHRRPTLHRVQGSIQMGSRVGACMNLGHLKPICRNVRSNSDGHLRVARKDLHPSDDGMRKINEPHGAQSPNHRLQKHHH